MIEQLSLYLELFLTFSIIALFNFGGGFVMITLIADQIIIHGSSGFISAETFDQIIAISQMTPGAIAINTATYVGYEIGGIPAALVSTLAIPIPSFLIVMVLSPILLKYKDHGLNKMIFYGIRPVVVALILYAAIEVAKRSLIDLDKWDGFASIIDSVNIVAIGIFGLSFILIYKFRLNPIFVILISAVLGAFLFSF